MHKSTDESFHKFLDVFPEIDLPITLTEDLSLTFSANNKPLPDQLVEDFILVFDTEVDEYTEFVPCFRIKETGNFTAIVYWKAMLMESKFILALYSNKGVPSGWRTLSTISHNEKGIVRSIATIDEDWHIIIVKGEEEHGSEAYDPTSSKIAAFDISPEGRIIIS